MVKNSINPSSLQEVREFMVPVIAIINLNEMHLKVLSWTFGFHTSTEIMNKQYF